MAATPSRRPLPTRRLILGLALGLALAGCRGESPPSNVDLVLPDGGGRRTPFTVRSAFAEYVELGDLRRELRVTLASYVVSCERYVAPGPDDVLLVVTVTLPTADTPKPGSIPAGAADVVGPDAGAVTRPSALTVARHAGRGYVFPAGGALELTEVDLGPTGRVRGILAFEFSGDATRPAASARGKFDARICRPQ